MDNTFDFFYGGEADQYSFYRIPRALVTGERFRGVSTDAKLLYGLMLDRMGLSFKNNWLDETGRVYIYYICNPNKTENCAFVYSENCFPKTASVEFSFLLRQARAGGNTLGRHLIQFFSPEETTPEQAYRADPAKLDELFDWVAPQI